MTEYGDTQSSLTPKDLDDQLAKMTSKIIEHTTTEVQTSKHEIMSLQNEIISLQHEMNKREKSIEDLLITRKNTKNVYYVGLLTGIIGIIAGFFNNIIYGIAGLGVAITAIVGIYEAKKNKW